MDRVDICIVINDHSFPVDYTQPNKLYFSGKYSKPKKCYLSKPTALISLIFGDAYRPSVIEALQRFINYKHNTSRIYTDLILEICSRKIYYFNDIPLNHYYTNNRPSIILDYMADGSHYSFNGGLVKKFLETQIFSE